MCGIVDCWDGKGAEASTLEQMTLRIRYRGPDDAGVRLSEDGQLALAQRRLSIIDLSPAGH